MKSKLELNEICNEWLEMKKLSIRDSTYCKYEWIIDSKIKPFFADYDMESIDEKIIRNYMNILLVLSRVHYLALYVTVKKDMD